ncbi:MAG: beta-galactosidase trimerization domain-containing protein [Candidatus Cyclobacteriaceae bacterium M3_2C_046]
MNNRSCILFILLIAFIFPELSAQQGHDFMHDKYDQLHDSPVQQKFKKIAPVPAGVVYIMRPGEGEKEIRQHFRTMKALGFTNLKQIMTIPGWELEEVQLIALEEGLVPWWYGEGGWEEINDDLLNKLGISRKLSMQEIRLHPEMVAYQNGVLKKRIEKIIEYKKQTGSVRAPRSSSGAYDPTVGNRGLDLTEKGERLFVKWAREYYGDIEKLNQAWNQYHHGLQAGALNDANAEPFADWQDFENRWQKFNHREFRVRTDILRFKAMHGLTELRQKAEEFHEFDENAPYRAGGELGLFRPHAYFGVDFPGIADVMRDHGSFYPSIHFTWHFDQVRDELGPTVYMQASYINDMFKGGWAGGWETTGGPQQFGGEKFGQTNKGFTVDAPEMQQFTLSMLASGFKGWGLWSWSIRTAGGEVGEYALLDHQNNVTERAIEVGKIGKAMQTYRDELWQAHKEPLVGVFFDWDNDAIWTALSFKGQDSLMFRPMQARVGACRALINADVPFEYLHPDDIKDGLAARYPVIFMPGILALNEELMPFLMDYVEQGGRLVMDMPGAWMDVNSALFPRGEGSEFAQLFGTVLREYQYSGINRNWHLQDQLLTGSIGSFNPLEANVIATFSNGKPAVTAHQYGQGQAVLVGYEAARNCFTPGQDEMESMMLKFALGDYQSPIQSDDAIVYRLASPKADHYFLLNEGAEKEAELTFNYYKYSGASDAVSGESVDLNGKIKLPAHGARWLRYEK